MSPEVLIVGAGFSGAVSARQLAEAGFQVRVIDSRSHIAGNCHTERDPASGILLHRYGPHIFNTDYEKVWNWIRQFGEFGPFINRVKAHTDRGIFSFPLNLHTLNQFFNRRMTPAEARELVESLRDKTIREPANFEEQALAMVGRELYETFFQGYTRKQWGVDPKELPASLLKRLPIRFSYDDCFYDKKYMGIPLEGYTRIVERILDHPGIRLDLNTPFRHEMMQEVRHTVYTGPIDAFFDHVEGRLGYRTVFWERTDGQGDAQGCAVMNYPSMSVPFTRIHEHKHFAPWESHERTVTFTEYSKETGPGDDPFYPKRLQQDKQMLERYLSRAEGLPDVTFLGRLGTYRYLDMDRTILEALEASGRLIEKLPRP